MTSIETKTFRSGNSQAIRLPREIAFPDDTDILITRIGDSLRIDPKPKMTPAELVDALRKLPKPSSIQKRLPTVAPKRRGL